MKIGSLILSFSLFWVTTLSCKPFFTLEQLQTIHFFQTPSEFLNSPEKMAPVDLFAQQKKVFVKNMSDREGFAFLTLTDYKIACALFPLLVKQMGTDKEKQKAILKFFKSFDNYIKKDLLKKEADMLLRFAITSQAHELCKEIIASGKKSILTTAAGDIHIFPQGTFPDYNSCTSASRTRSTLSLHTSCRSLSSEESTYDNASISTPSEDDPDCSWV